jgi:hypothetical protein
MITIRNNTIRGRIVSVVLQLTVTLVDVRVSVIENRVLFDIATQEPQAFYMLFSSAILGNGTSLTVQDNYVTVNGSTVNSTVVRVVELQHVGLSSPGARLDVSRNHLDAGEAGCACVCVLFVR